MKLRPNLPLVMTGTVRFSKECADPIRSEEELGIRKKRDHTECKVKVYCSHLDEDD